MQRQVTHWSDDLVAQELRKSISASASTIIKGNSEAITLRTLLRFLLFSGIALLSVAFGLLSWYFDSRDVGSGLISGLLAALILLAVAWLDDAGFNGDTPNRFFLKKYGQHTGGRLIFGSQMKTRRRRDLQNIGNEYLLTFDMPSQLSKTWLVDGYNCLAMSYGDVKYTLTLGVEEPYFSVPAGVLPNDQRKSTDPLVLFERVRMSVARAYGLSQIEGLVAEEVRSDSV